MLNNNKNISILLVEDDPISNFISHTKLKQNGFEKVDIVENGQLAVSYLEKRIPHLIFLDINMPVMDGFEFLEYLKKSNRYSKTKIVMLTSSIRPCDREYSKEFKNVIDFLEKPLNKFKIEYVLDKLSMKDKNYM